MILQVLDVEEYYAGANLEADVAAGATVLPVSSVAEFPDAGTVLLGAEQKTYSVVDPVALTITLDTALASPHIEGNFVYIYPQFVSRRAFLAFPQRARLAGDDNDTSANGEGTAFAQVPHALWDKLPLGLRDIGKGEYVSVDYQLGKLALLDIVGKKPSVDGGYINPGTLPPTSVGTDGSPPASSPAATVLGGPSFLYAKWTAVANVDSVVYDVHLSTTNGFTPSGGTLYASTPATSIIIKTLVGGGALSYGTTYYVKLVARDADGSAVAGTQGSAQMVKIANTDILANTITANEIAAATITADRLNVTQLSAIAADLGTITAGTVTGATIQTATSGSRIVLNSAGMAVYDNANAQTLTIDNTGSIFLEGIVTFGTSTLNADGTVQVKGVAASGNLTPDRGTSACTASGNMTQTTGSFSLAPPVSTTAGSTLLLAVYARSNSTGTAPTFTTPAGWTVVGSSQTNGAARMTIYKREAAPAISSQSITITQATGDTFGYIIELLEYVNSGVVDVTVGATGTSTSPTATTAATTQAEEISVGFIGWYNNVGAGSESGVSAGYVANQRCVGMGGIPPVAKLSSYDKKLAATGTQTFAATLPISDPWIEQIVTIKGSAAAAVPPTPSAGFGVYYAAVDANSNIAPMFKDDDGVAWDLRRAKPSIGASPPANPVDGDRWVYTGSGFDWEFIYDSSETTYKWKFVGGGSLEAHIDGSDTVAALGYLDPTNVGPSVTLPRDGDYEVAFGATFSGTPSSAFAWFASLKLNAVATADADAAQFAFASAAGASVASSVSRTRRYTARVANDVLKMQYKAVTVGMTVSARWITVRPVKVI